jgi:xanthine/CO dehydrogenase XdhC/CoxF family maturation factor
VKEFLEILAVAKSVRKAGQPYAVATVVKIGGSSYRRPGARMLVRSDGQSWGTISGGCLEAEVARQAIDVIESRQPRLLPFELGEDDLVLGFGSGCDGIVHVFIEPILPDSTEDVLSLFARTLEARRSAVLATVTQSSGSLAHFLGRHLLLDVDGRSSGDLNQRPLDKDVRDAAQTLLNVEQAEGQTYLWHSQRFGEGADSAEVLLEIVRPAIRLIVFGDGHDVRAMIVTAKTMGWQIVVVGRKPTTELATRFPDADEHVFLMHPEEVLQTIQPDARSAALIMNHTYVRDRELMSQLLSSDIPYVGLLGPRERTVRMLGELEGAGRTITDVQRKRLFGPVGLDIGTETPEEIALASAAEIQATLHRRFGGNLRTRTEPIHSTRSTLEG